MVRRSGTDPSADLYLEPPPGDCFQKDFTIAVMYADGQNANANAKADAHTKPDLAVDPKAPGFERLDAWLYLTGDEKLYGKLEAHRPGRRPDHDALARPSRRAALASRRDSSRLARPQGIPGVVRQAAEGPRIGRPAAGPDQERRSPGDPGHRGRDRGRQAAVPVPGPDPDAAAQASRRPGHGVADRIGPRRTISAPSFTLPADVVVSGRWKDLDTSVWKVETPWGQELKLPAADVQSVRFRGGKLTYLSDLNPEQGRRDAVLRPPAPLAPGRQPAGRAAEDQRPDVRSRRGGPFAVAS